MEQEYRKKWTLIPDALPAAIRRCPKCGCKSEFLNSRKFRVNANGRMLDIWLVYRCRKCETTWNMAVYERIEADALEPGEYEGFLNNNSGLAAAIGSRRELFARNRTEMRGASDGFSVRVTNSGIPCQTGTAIRCQTDSGIPCQTDPAIPCQPDSALPCQDNGWEEAEVWLGGSLRPRVDTLFAKEMGISRNQVKKLCESGQICTSEGKAEAGARVKDGQIFYFKRQ